MLKIYPVIFIHYSIAVVYMVKCHSTAKGKSFEYCVCSLKYWRSFSVYINCTLLHKFFSYSFIHSFSKFKTMNTTATKNSTAKANSTAKGNSKETKGKTATKKTEKVIFLSGNVTGRELQGFKSIQNRDAKLKLRSISSCITAIKESEGKFLESFINYDVKDITPTNLIPLRNEKEILYSDTKGFSTWLVLGLIKRYYQQNTYKKIVRTKK